MLPRWPLLHCHQRICFVDHQRPPCPGLLLQNTTSTLASETASSSVRTTTPSISTTHHYWGIMYHDSPQESGPLPIIKWSLRIHDLEILHSPLCFSLLPQPLITINLRAVLDSNPRRSRHSIIGQPGQTNTSETPFSHPFVGGSLLWQNFDVIIISPEVPASSFHMLHNILR